MSGTVSGSKSVQSGLEMVDDFVVSADAAPLSVVDAAPVQASGLIADPTHADDLGALDVTVAEAAVIVAEDAVVVGVAEVTPGFVLGETGAAPKGEVAQAAAPQGPIAAIDNSAPVIYEIFGGGGNVGAPYNRDYIVVHNPTSAAISLSGWSVQYASSTGTSWQVTALSGSIPAGGYYLVGLASGANGAALPTVDASGTTAMSGSAGKVALVNTTTALTGQTPTAGVVDIVSYGTASNSTEGTPTGTLSNTTAAIRINFGNTDSNNNGADFTVGTPNPFNTASTPHPANTSPLLSINDISVTEGDAGQTLATFTVTLSAAAGPGGVTFDISTADGTATAGVDYVARSLTSQTIPEGQTTFTFTVEVTGDTAFEPDETVLVNVTNVTGAQVQDGQGQLTILNDDASPTPLVSISPTSISQPEGNAGATTYTYTVTREGDTSVAVTVDFAVTGSGPNPANGADFVGGDLPSGVVSFEAGQTTATITIQVNGDNSFEFDEGFTVTLSNVSAGGVIGVGSAGGVIANDDYVPIYTIQGEGHISAFNGQAVTTQGVVTAVVTVGSARGYYIQDVAGDGNVNTSDALFVFTGSTTPTVQVGQLLSVSGTVTEFRSSGALSLTEITGATATFLGTAELPEAVIIGEGEGMRTPPKVQIGDNDVSGVFDPATQGSDFYETMEGMRVTVKDAISVSAFKNSNGEMWVRSGTITTNSLNDRGGYTISDTTPDTTNPADKIFDFNPERIKINDTISSLPTLNGVGDKFGDISGVLSYNFGSYELLNTAPVTITQASTLEKEVTSIEASLDTVRVASFNVRNLSPVGTQDGEGSDGSTQAEMNARAIAIVTNLKSPDIIALQELQDNNGTLNDSLTDASLTLQQLIDAIVANGGPRYKAIDSNPADDQDGGVGGGNIRVAYLYNPEVVTPTAANGLVQDGQPDVFEYNLANRIGVGNSDFSATRKSLPIEWSPAGYTATEGGTFYVINNHFSSKGGSATLVGGDMGNPQYGEPVNSGAVKREGQAIAVKAFIDGILSDGNAMNDKFVVLGDFNDFQFFPVVQLVTGQLVRTSIGSGNTDSTFAAGQAVLRNLGETLDPSERYSYNFEGNAQALDQVLVSANLYGTAVYDIVHINSEFANQISDHDPAIAALLMPRSAALATAGDDVLDQAAFTARFGATRGSLDGADRISGLAGNDIIAGGNGNDMLNGDEGDDMLMGGAGDDRLDGGVGADTMIGGIGDDTYYVDDAGDVVTENADEGEDTVITTLASYTLTANVENLIGAGNGQTLIGNDGDNSILGSIGDDIIVGGKGADAINGDLGVDHLDYGLSAEGVTVNLATGTGVGGDAQGDTYLSIENVTGSYYNDVLTGDAGANALFGGNGDDVLDGGDGADVLVGGAGVDSLTGGEGNDILYFGAEDSLVSGGAGFDVGYVTSGSGMVLNLETASLEYVIDTVGGNDWFQGTTRTEAVTVFAGGGADTVQGGSANDVLWGEAGDDILVGNGGDDVLVGGAGADLMNGGVGRDILYGGANDGAQDLFRFTVSGAANWDYVHDFETGIDKIDLRGMPSSFADVTFVTADGNTQVFVAGEQICTVIGVTALTASDFLFETAVATAKDFGPLVQPLAEDDVQPTVGVSTEVADDLTSGLLPSDQARLWYGDTAVMPTHDWML